MKVNQSLLRTIIIIVSISLMAMSASHSDVPALLVDNCSDGQIPVYRIVSGQGTWKCENAPSAGATLSSNTFTSTQTITPATDVVAAKINPSSSQSANLIEVTSDGSSVRFRLDKEGRIGSRGALFGNQAISATPSYDLFQFSNAVTIQANSTNNFIRIAGNDPIKWTNTSDNADTTADVGVVRNALGILEINSSTAIASGGTAKHLALAHVIGASATPAIAAGAGAGTSPTVSIAGTDLAGQITVTSGTLPSVSSIIVTVTFSQAYVSAPYCIMWPANGNASVLGFLPFVSSTTTTFTVNAATLGLGAATQYLYNYHCAQ